MATTRLRPTSAAARGAQRGLLLSVLLNAVVPVVVYNLALRSVTSSEATRACSSCARPPRRQEVTKGGAGR
jgi:hypothetical protein